MDAIQFAILNAPKERDHWSLVAADTKVGGVQRIVMLLSRLPVPHHANRR